LVTSLRAHASGAVTTLRVLGGAGVIRPYGPRTLLALGRTVLRWGTGPAGGFASLAVRDPHGIGLVDELGELTFGEMQRRSNALARGLAALGVGEGDSVAIMCRNHRGFVDASVAVAKLGADLLYLNTAFAGPQLVDVLEREQPSVVIHDEEFTRLLEKAHVEQRVIAWTDSDGSADSDDERAAGETIEALIAASDDAELQPPQRHSRVVILTSGTTGTPKGAPRSEAGIDAAVSMLSRMPLRHGWRTHIAAPLFHTWGFAHLALAMLLGSTVVLHRRFDPETALRTVERERCESLVVIPVMLQRILALDEEVLARYSLPTLRVVAASGSALPGALATSWMDHFGDNLYNIYGSTEVAYASIATPEDLREAPSSAGLPPYGTVVRIYDQDGHEVPQGTSGRIFVGNGLLFEGYTGGGGKDMIDGLMATGDVGRFGDDGRLYVDGRDDEMIVSGGENVFPKEVEDCLVGHDAVAEVAVVGVEDDDYGTRLRAFVARRGEVTEDELKDHVKSQLARYKVPREIVFLDELPRNATGKVLKRDLAHWDEETDESTDEGTDGGAGEEQA
jgi:acyl-CoA synthetase (AMP-forming)/AMP-acid ligase II